LAGTALAQVEPRGFTHLTVAEGLSQSMVYCIAQDSKGYLWFGTEDGLNRYDGYTIRVFRSDPRRAGAARVNPLINIYALCADPQGGLWVGAYGGGLSYYDPASEQFRTYLPDPQDSTSLSSYNVAGLCVDHEGVLWVAILDGGLNRFDRSDGTFVRYRPKEGDPTSLSSAFVRCVYEDRSGRLWVGTDGAGLNLFERAEGRFRQYRHDPRDPKSLIDDYVRGICQGSRGTLWLATDGGLEEFDPERGVFIHHIGRARAHPGIPGERLWTVLEDAQGNVWYGTRGGGLVKYEPATGRATRFAYNPADPHSLRSDVVWSLLEDRNGVLWVGTMSGVSAYKVHLSKFPLYRHDPDDPNSLCDNSVRAFLEDRHGDLWVGTDNGLSRLRRSAGCKFVFTSYVLDTTRFSATTGRRVFALAGDSTGGLWIGTYGGGLARLDRATGRLTRYRGSQENPRALPSDFIRALHCDREGALWVGTVQGLARYDHRHNAFARFSSEPNDSTTLSGNQVLDICAADSGRLWIATSAGLNLFDPHTGRCRRYLRQEDDPYSLSTDYVTAVYQDARGVVWLGTFGGGLNRLDPATGRCTVYTEAEGLANNVVYGILADRQGRLWLSTNAGLSRFDPATGSFRTYGVADGLQSNEFNAGAYLLGRDGTMYFGGVEGFNAFHPEAMHDDPVPPAVVLTGFRLFNQPVPIGEPVNGRVLLPRAIGEVTSLRLSYADRVLTFEFVGLHSICPARITYAYKMDGFDRDWNYVGTRRFATYTNLPPGKYQFKVKAANGDGVWSEPAEGLAVEVVPPFWMRWWFKLAATVACVAIGMGAVQWRTSAVRRQNAELEMRVAQRTAELRKVNRALSTEVAERKRAEMAVRAEREQLLSVMESISEPIYVVDMDTHEILFANGALERPFGKPLVGGTCYRELQGLDAPCPFCTNGRIRELDGEPYEWDYHNPIVDRDYHLVDRVIRWPDGRRVRFEMAIDVTERNRAMAKLTTSLEEKEVLLKEIHHRVKNNMQVISSMLRLQAGYIDDARALELFQESQNRVKSMALIHEKLYQSQDLARIDFADYLRNLTSHLFRSYSGRSDITLNLEVSDVRLGVDVGIPCGLIVNELVSNALKHAFPNGRSGQITVSLQRTDDTYVLSVKDDGVGFPKDVDFRDSPSLGLQLVNTLTTQLEGEVELISNGQGTEFRITFGAESA
jgi:two-component sensor histidine kinase/ligand-binding sensor domain-containing protein